MTFRGLPLWLAPGAEPGFRGAAPITRLEDVNVITLLRCALVSPCSFSLYTEPHDCKLDSDSGYGYLSRESLIKPNAVNG